jgi:hypothetical protein
MQKFLPWLLVPLAAWLGVRETGTPRPPEPPTAPVAAAAAVPAWLDASVTSIAAADLESLLQRLLPLQEPPFTHEKAGEFRLICARLAELDPAAALAWIDKNLSDHGWNARMSVLTEWALLDSDAAWAFLPAGPEGDQDRSEVTRRLLHEDRELFMEWFRRVRQPMPNGDPAWLLVAERYPAELEEIANELLKRMETPTEGMRFDFAPLFHLLAKNRAGKDPASALEWAMGLAPSVRAAARRGVLEVWAEKDPIAAWKELSRSPPNRETPDFIQFHQDHIGTLILKRIARDDPAAAMKLILDPENKAGIFDSGAIEAMRNALGPAVARGEIDPVEAYRLLNSAKGSDSNLPMNVFIKMWFGMPAERLAAAANGILAEPDDRLRGTALSGIAAAWMQNDPAAALAFIGGIADDEVRRGTWSGAFRMANGGILDPLRQPEMVAQIPAADRAAVLAGLFSRYETPTPGQSPYLSSTDETRPELVVPLLEDAPPSADLTRAAGFAALKWGEADPMAALAWADSVADPAARAAAHAGAIDGWAYHDPLSAAAWLAEKPAGPERDAATVPLVRRLASSDPAAAWEWAAAVGDADLQSDARISALKAWSGQAPDEARAAYENHLATLPPAEAAEFARRYAAP